MTEENSADRLLNFIVDRDILLDAPKLKTGEGIGNFVPQLDPKLEVPLWKKILLEQPILELKTELSFSFAKPSLPVKPILEPDAAWRNKLIHPSIVLILGKRGSGKSALAYRLLELFRYGPQPYVVGVPAAARTLLPDWIGMVPSLEDLPNKAISIYDWSGLPPSVAKINRST